MLHTTHFLLIFSFIFDWFLIQNSIDFEHMFSLFFSVDFFKNQSKSIDFFQKINLSKNQSRVKKSISIDFFQSWSLWVGFCIEFEPFALRYTALRATSTRSWHHSLLHLWRYSCPVSSHDYSWLLNVHTLHKNGFGVSPHCIVCTEQQVFANPI